MLYNMFSLVIYFIHSVNSKYVSIPLSELLPPTFLLGVRVCMHATSLQSCLTLCDPMDCNPPDSSVYGDSPGKNTGVGCHSFLQGIFPTRGSNLCLLCLLHCHLGSPFLVGVYTSVLYICVSVSALQIESSIPFFWISQILVNI